MTVFEELIVELKEENLLEQTVIDSEQQPARDDDFDFTDAPNAIYDIPQEMSSVVNGQTVETAHDLFYELETPGADDGGADPVLDADVELVDQAAD
ncbi:MAG: hypothetical protein ABJB40_14685, partial [Acidobacteriota bacterium]